jgi:hypothetical protein
VYLARDHLTLKSNFESRENTAKPTSPGYRRFDIDGKIRSTHEVIKYAMSVPAGEKLAQKIAEELKALELDELLDLKEKFYAKFDQEVLEIAETAYASRARQDDDEPRDEVWLSCSFFFVSPVLKLMFR